MSETISLAQAVNQAATLLAAAPARAQSEAESILKAAPGDPRALLILASAKRRQGDATGANAILAPLAKAYPRAARTQYELGLVLADLGQEAAAMAALRGAVALNPDLAEAWGALGDRLFKEGKVAGAEAAYAEQERASVQNPALRPAADALFAGDSMAAEMHLRAHLLTHPDDVNALRLLAEAFLRQDRLDEAEFLFAQCLERDPDQDGARFSYAMTLFRRQAAAEALDQMRRLIARDPDNSAYRNLTAASLALAGRHDEALTLYEVLLAEFPDHPRIWLNYGHALRTLRRREDAVDAYKRAIALAPQLGEAYWSLANLKTVPLTETEEAAMAGQLERPDIAADDRLHLSYALGKALEDRGEYAAAFERYADGARVCRSLRPYSADAETALMERSVALFTPAFFETRVEVGSADDAPIFIVGLPRSGSTLIEQILASHSAVEGTMELYDIPVIAQSLRGTARDGAPARCYPEAVVDIDPAAWSALGERYIEHTRFHRHQRRPHFIDKMPNNFQHVGLIHAILPNAKIIDVRRHPMAACFSAFKQHFAQGQAFSYDLVDLARYYADYVSLMTHFDAVLPDRVHRVIYEDVVEDTEGQIRRLLDYCGLPFEAACLGFHENTRAVRTVSSEQVRRPIFRDGLEQWRHFEPWLSPLRVALGPTLEDWRGVPMPAKESR